MTVPEDIRVTGLPRLPDSEEQKTVTWIIEITSQIIFSANAEVKYELLVSRDERSLDYNFLAVPNGGHGQPGHVRDHQQGKRRQDGHHPAQPKGVYSKAVTLVVDDTDSLWDRPKLPTWEDDTKLARKSVDVSRRMSFDRRKSADPKSERKAKRRKKKIHLVILTHGIHSNLGADMLYLKESIDASAKQARENARERREEAKANAAGSSKSADSAGADDKDTSTAPLSGGQEALQREPEDDDEDEEEIIVRGFNGNATKTEKGIQWLGKRLARYIFQLTYPDQPFKPMKKSMSQKITDRVTPRSSRDREEQEEGVPAHSNSTIRQESTDEKDLPYTFTSISFVGHSLGGLVQLYAIGYIQKHAPHFFEQIRPVNFIAMASPLLGLSNENPMYVRFALDFGLVGRTGQDLGLTWRPPTIAKSGWSAMIGGLGIGDDQHKQEDPGAKPLLRILPTGPAHRVLRMFRNRTVYSNVVNDGIVPLRTSCLLFLDWRGLDRVTKARRENGLIGTMATWGWSELTGQNTSPNPSRFAFELGDETVDSDDAPEASSHHQSEVPQPAENETNEGDKDSTAIPKSHHVVQQHIHTPQGARKSSAPVEHGTSTFDDIWNFFKPSAKTTKKDLKMFKRSQTLMPDSDGSNPASPRRPSSEAETQNDRRESSPPNTQGKAPNGRPTATRGDSLLEDPDHPSAPPKTTIFESAGDILNPPIPPLSWVIDPSTRARTIFHDRVYHPEDIPPPPPSKSRSKSLGASVSSADTADSQQSASDSTSGMRVEEKIARAYHKDLSWRKVLVRLEPDAHNNMIVRRMFANAYGWPVIKHLCDTHFGDTYAAVTRDEFEPATDRAKGVEAPVGEEGEMVKGQESRREPVHGEGDMREDADELPPLRSHEEAGSASKASSPRLTMKDDSMSSWDSRYFRDDDSDYDDDSEASGKGGPLGFIRPPRPSHQPKRPSKSRLDVDDGLPHVASFLTEEPPPLSPPLEGHRGLGPMPIHPGPKTPTRTTADVGLRKSLDEVVRPGSGGKRAGGS